jgi:hypothetical protein
MSNLFNDAATAGDDRNDRDERSTATSQPSLCFASKRWLFPAIALLWLCLTAGGMHLLFRYMNQPGSDRPAPAIWPSESRIPHSGAKPTLIMFVHPHCSCSDASLTQLEAVLERNPGRLDAVLAFIRPPGVTKEWSKTSLWHKAVANPAFHAVVDRDGAEALRFGASTSGRALLYSSEGKLLFDGGLTAARGETGDSPGCLALNAILAGAPAPVASTPVFGCPLLKCNRPVQLPTLAGHPSPTILE